MKSQQIDAIDIKSKQENHLMPIFISKPYVLTCFSFVDTVIWLTSFARVVCTSISTNAMFCWQHLFSSY